MVYRILFFGFLYLAAPQGLANVTYADFKSSANTIRSTSGNVVHLRRVESFDYSTKTAGVVIDAKDKFGNTVQQKKLLKINPSKFKAWTLACVRLGTACGAAAAITASLAVATWYFDVDLGQLVSSSSSRVFDPMNSANRCPSNLEIIGYEPPPSSCPTCPGAAIYSRRINCFEVGSTVTYYLSNAKTPELEAWKSPGTIPAVISKQNIHWSNFSNASTPSEQDDYAYDVHYKYRLNLAPSSAPKISYGVKTDPTPEQVVETVSENPLAWQISPGEFPDIFDSPELSENPATDPDSLPIQDIVGGQPSTADLVDMSAVANQTFNVADYLEHDSFLPSECPQPMVFNISQTSFTITFDTLCNYAVIIRPFIVFSGLILWLVIVWRGLSL